MDNNLKKAMSTADQEIPEYGPEMRKLFMLRENSVCVNQGSYGCVPREVHEAQVRYLKEMESHPDEWFRYKLEKYLTKAVMNLSEFLHTGPYDTFFLQNATKAINTVLKTYPLQPGDAYLITDLSYPAVNKATYASSERRIEGAKTYTMNFTIPITSEEEVVEKYDKFFEEHKNVKIAVIDHISSPTPVLQPVRKLVEVCHRHGVISVIDGAHAPGQIPLNLPEIDADFYAGNLHKWLFTPRGTGFIWMNPKRKKDWFKPLVTSTYDGSGLHIEFGYEGTKDDTPYICSINGLNFFKNKLGGFDKTLPYTKALRQKSISYLEERWGTKRLDIPESMVAPYMQMIKLPYLKDFSNDPENQWRPLMKYVLERFDIQVAVNNIQGELFARLSFTPYVVFEDVVKLADAIETMHKESVETSEKTKET